MTNPPTHPGPVGQYTPLYEAQNAGRYERQELIRQYQEKYDCCLIVASSPIAPYFLAYFEELIHHCDPGRDLHLILNSMGGDGETALRMVRSVQTRCNHLTVVIPDQAKSAATLLTLGAHRILMGPFGDLGPIDPQITLDSGQSWVPAKDIIASVEDASTRIEAAPASYPFWASLFGNITGINVQQARTAIRRSEDQLREALEANPDRKPDEVSALVGNLKGPLIEMPQSHGAVFGAADARRAGLPVEELSPTGEQWHEIWRLWSRYSVLGLYAAYEGDRASQLIPYT
jgi:hypothetical protein